MKSIALLGFAVVSLAAVVLCETGAYYYAPEYVNYQSPTEETAIRTKRGVDPASLAFLVGVGTGGLFGPILYNRLYGWKPVSVGWPQPQPQGWPEPQGWAEAESSGGYH